MLDERYYFYILFIKRYVIKLLLLEEMIEDFIVKNVGKSIIEIGKSIKSIVIDS